MKQSLGLVEVNGLALAITVADHMVKSSNVTLLGVEKTKGFGWMLIKVAGDVGSVEAAVDCGADLARQHNGLVACKTIARPGDEVATLTERAEGKEHKEAAKVVEGIVDNMVEGASVKPEAKAAEKPARRRHTKKAAPEKAAEV